MSSIKDIEAELMKQDLYQMLNVDPSADEKTIKKAYRKQALRCHPDKNPDDPQAAHLFLKLSKVLEILCDADARKSYDRILKARQAAALRNREVDNKRKKLKDDLEARERAAEASQVDVKRDMAKLQAEIERLRKEGSKQLQEEQEFMRQQLRKDQVETSKDDADEDHCRVKIKWAKVTSDGDASGYDEGTLRQIFKKYGDISALILSKKKNGSGALLEFVTPEAARNASRYETGLPGRPLSVTLLGESQPTPAAAPQRDTGPAPVKPQASQAAFDTFESLVLRNMRQAEERKRLIDELKKEEEQC